MHWPSFMQGDLVLSRPQGPWIMCLVIVAKSAGSSLGSGSSALMMLSISSGRIFSTIPRDSVREVGRASATRSCKRGSV